MAIMTDRQCMTKRCSLLARYHCIYHRIWNNGSPHTRRCDRFLCEKHYRKHEDSAYHVTRNK